jgi:PAS domain-containing protein
VLVFSAQKRAELVESALVSLYRRPATGAMESAASETEIAARERDELLGLIQTIMKSDQTISNLFERAGYVVCDRHLVITFVNQAFLKRSDVASEEILGKSLYFEREYEGTQIEQLYSMVMETRLMADALVRYVMRTAGGVQYDGWFVLVVIPLDDGGIGVLSRFAEKRDEIADEIGTGEPDAPRFIVLNT